MKTLTEIKKEEVKKSIRSGIVKFEEALGKLPEAKVGDAWPLKHKFVDGMYIREITMPKGLLVTSKIHKFCHPYFILKGDVSVLTEEGSVRIKAPYYGITPAGTKRLIYNHEETVWVTVHRTEETDKESAEEELIAKDFEELGIEVDRNINEPDVLKFIEAIKKKEEENATIKDFRLEGTGEDTKGS